MAAQQQLKPLVVKMMNGALAKGKGAVYKALQVRSRNVTETLPRVRPSVLLRATVLSGGVSRAPSDTDHTAETFRSSSPTT